jgi:hypothetical protein
LRRCSSDVIARGSAVLRRSVCAAALRKGVGGGAGPVAAWAASAEPSASSGAWAARLHNKILRSFLRVHNKVLSLSLSLSLSHSLSQQERIAQAPPLVAPPIPPSMNDEASFQAHLRRLIFLALHWNHCLRFKRQRLAFACQKPYDLPLADPSFPSSPLIFFLNFNSLSFSLPLSL